MIDTLTRLWLKFLAGSSLPPRWFYPSPPALQDRAARGGMLHVEVVSHCWQYSRLLAYQLSSLIQYPVSDCRITMTVFYGVEDKATVKLLEFIAGHEVPNVSWNWQSLPPPSLFRRAIGRNLAAKASTADWVWFTDCDLTFQSGCLDSLNLALQGRQQALLYPRTESKTNVYSDADVVTDNAIESPELLFVEPDAFVAWPVTRATGPLQITHGDVARSVGYCDDVDFYQRPSNHWAKCVEDRMFRFLLGTQGTAIDVDGVCRIQHAVKGRYLVNSRSSTLRQGIRALQHRFRR